MSTNRPVNGITLQLYTLTSFKLTLKKLSLAKKKHDIRIF